jgi:hypothetical protein
MRTSRAIRTLAVLASAGLIVGAFAAVPAEAKKKKKKKPAVCSTFTPGANGEGKPTLVVTDTATEEAPAVQAISLAPELTEGIPGALGGPPPPSDVFNIQVDSAAKEAGLYILWEFQERRDYDLNVWHIDGSYAARSHGFQPILGINPAIDESQGNLGGHAGESTTASEKIVGLRTSDCGGWTVSAENFLGEGGDFEIKVWLGAIENDPQAPGAETP